MDAYGDAREKERKRRRDRERNCLRGSAECEP